MVEDIHREGGTILSSSRGGTENMDLLVDTLEKWGSTSSTPSAVTAP
jgi:hypothetical protein